MRLVMISCAILALFAVSDRAEAAQCRTGHAATTHHAKACSTLKLRLETLKSAEKPQR
jgi:hypothetical protein